MMRTSNKYVLYFVYTLFALGVFLYLRFPAALVEDLMLKQLKQIDPDIQLTTTAVALTPSVGIRLDAPALAYADIPVVHLDQFKIRPQLMTLFRKKKHFSLSGSMGTGRLTGRMESEFGAQRPQSMIVLNLDSTQIDYIDALNQWPAFLVDGLMDAIVKYDSSKAGGTADISAEISPLKITLESPLMGLETLEFRSIAAQMTVTQRMLQIRNCDASGDQLEGKLSGSIVFRQPMENSRLSLSLTVKPQPAFIADHRNDMIGGLLASENAQKRGVVFRISGTVANPRYVIR